MADSLYTFMFDPNFNSSVDSVFAQIDPNTGGVSPPPADNYFLLLNGQVFGLLSGGDLILL